MSNYQLSINNYQLPKGYKQTEVGVIPEDWDIYSLQSLTANSESITYGVLKPGNYVYNGIPLLQIKDVIHGDIKAEELHKIGEQLDRQYSRTRLSGGEIVVSLVGTIGKIAYIPPFLLGANLHRNLAKISISEEHDSKFVFYQLKSERIQAAIKITTFGSTQALFNLGDLRSLPIVVPPLPEQRAIATALSDVDALIAALDKLIAKKRHLKTATMQQLLTGKKRLPGFGEGKGYKQTEVGVIPEDWEARSLITMLNAPPKYGINAAAVSHDGKHPSYVRITDISEDGHFQPEKLVAVDHPDSDQYFLEEGDLVFARTGASVGKSYLYDPNDGELVYAGFLIKIKPDPNLLLPFFLSQYVKTQVYWNWVQVMSMRSGQPGINGNEYGQLLLPLPSVEEQRAISTVLSDMDAEIAALEARRAKTQAIKQGMMQELLTGRTRLV